MEVLRFLRTRLGRVTRMARGALVAAALIATAPAPPLHAQPPAAAGDARWPVKTREHVDLWLHGFALISEDSSTVPLFRRGYRDALVVQRNAASAFTDLDANRDALSARLRASPALINAQFLALYFGSWPDLAGSIDAFLRTADNARAGPVTGPAAVIAAAFRSKDDRDFARRFVNALRTEQEKFFHLWWLAETRRRERTLAAVDSLWQGTYRPRLQNFLSHTQQASGDVILALALEGEGRTVAEGKSRNLVAIGYPESPERAMEAIYEIAHELIGPIAGAAVDDNTTPAEKRGGVAERLTSVALVRGGAILLARVSADAAAGYARFYLRVAGRHADAGLARDADVMAAFEQAFPLPKPLLDSLDRQVAVAFGGI
jgi:hypothetical protein